MAQAKKRNIATKIYEEKLVIIDYAEKNSHMKKKDIAIHFNVPKQTLSDILKNKDKIPASCSPDNSLTPVAKRQRSTLHPEVNKALIIWTKQKGCRPDIRLDGTMLLQKANMFLRIFSPHVTNELSPAWIDHFKKRYGLGRIQKGGESGGMDTDVVNEWKDGKLREILETIILIKFTTLMRLDFSGFYSWIILLDSSVKSTMALNSQNPE